LATLRATLILACTAEPLLRDQFIYETSATQGRVFLVDCGQVDAGEKCMNSVIDPLESSGRFIVRVYDNFRYGADAEYVDVGTFDTPALAWRACQQIIDEWLTLNRAPGMTAAALFEAYRAFGDNPVVVASFGSDSSHVFAAHEYARRRCEEIFLDSV
jgi:hypothetical protein